MGACDVLNQMNGYIENMNLDPNAACVLIAPPCAIIVPGHHGARSVFVTRRFDNGCPRNVAPGPLHDF